MLIISQGLKPKEDALNAAKGAASDAEGRVQQLQADFQTKVRSFMSLCLCLREHHRS